MVFSCSMWMLRIGFCVKAGWRVDRFLANMVWKTTEVIGLQGQLNHLEGDQHRISLKEWCYKAELGTVTYFPSLIIIWCHWRDKLGEERDMKDGITVLSGDFNDVSPWMNSEVNGDQRKLIAYLCWSWVQRVIQFIEAANDLTERLIADSI